MSPVFITNPNKICSQLDSSSMPAIALNNTQIRTFINIYPPSLPPPLPQIDLRKYNPSTIAAQAFYHFYFPHLLAGQNQQQTHEIIDRGIKRSNHSDGKFHIYIICLGLFFYFKNHYHYKNEKQLTNKNVLILLN